MTETRADGYSYESTHRELSNEYQHDRVQMIFKNLFVLVLWTKVASALEGLKSNSPSNSLQIHALVLFSSTEPDDNVVGVL